MIYTVSLISQSFFKMNLKLKLLNMWNSLVEKVKARAIEAKASRAIARQERAEVRAIERDAYHKERMVAAVKEGKARARQPRGFAGFQSGLQNLSKNIDKIAPPNNKRYKGQTMADVLGTNKTKGKSMLDMKF